MNEHSKTVKDNVSRFDDDVRRTGSYAYTAEKLSARYANGRVSEGIARIYPFESKRVLDLGCGDGTYSLEFVMLGAKEVLGIDPASVAVEAASKKALAAGMADKLRFEVGNIYDPNLLQGRPRFDCVVLRGVLHHLPDPERAVVCAAGLADSMIILEPNGYNPVLKILERVSRYHIEHEEQSFFSTTLTSWIRAAGFQVKAVQHINLVPMFCPDWMAKVCRSLSPIVERIPVVRTLGCGQCLILASRG